MNPRQYLPFPEPRILTRDEVVSQRVLWYADQDIARWREKRRKTHRLLKAARRRIQQLEDQARERG